jgi:site-specific DNA recombinase
VQRGLKSLAQQHERLTDAYLGGVIQLPEYQRRREELEQRRQRLANQAQLFTTQVERDKELRTMASALENFCQRARAGLLQATFAQKRQLIDLLIDRVIVTDQQVEVRYGLPTSPRGEQTRFSYLHTDYFF